MLAKLLEYLRPNVKTSPVCFEVRVLESYSDEADVTMTTSSDSMLYSGRVLCNDINSIFTHFPVQCVREDSLSFVLI